MADERPFNEYFANRTVLPGGVLIAGDELMVLRGGTVYRHPGAALFAYGSMNANAVETVITTIDVWVPIGGTLIDSPLTSAAFSFAANEYTYVGPNQAGPQILSAKMSISKAGGGDNIYEVGIFVNGVLEGTGMSVGASTALVGFATTGNPYSLQTNDVIDMRVRNLSGNSSCTLFDAQLIIG
jgi:hypothetical protein